MIGEGLTSFSKKNLINFSGEKSKVQLSGVSIFGEYAKKELLRQISSSASNLKDLKDCILSASGKFYVKSSFLIYYLLLSYLLFAQRPIL